MNRFVLLLLFCRVAQAALHGTVSDASTGKAVPQVTVTLHVGMDTVDEATTDDRGEFRFATSRKGTFRVVAARDGWADMNSRFGQIGVQVAEKDVALTFTLVKAGAITGRVIDSTGKPARYTFVAPIQRVTDQGVTRFLPGNPKSAPDDRGVYRISELLPGRYLVAVIPDIRGSAGFQSRGNAFLPVYHPGVTDPARARWIVLKPGEARSGVDFMLNAGPSYAVEGTVTGGEGKIDIALVPATGYSDQLQIVAAESDGRFRFPAVPTGGYWLIAGAPVRGYAFFGTMLGDNPRFGRQRVEVAGPVQGVSIALETGVSLQGKLSFAAGETPDPGCFTGGIVLSPLEPIHGTPGILARVSPDGTFTAKDLQPARYRLAPRLKAGCFATDLAQEVAIHGSTGVVKSVITAKTARVTGTAPPNAFVVLYTDADVALLANTQADVEGRYHFDSVGPGTYRLMALPALDTNHHLDPLFWSDHARQTVEVKLAPGGAATAKLEMLKPNQDWQ
jgi:uncharacterized protein (DUF2141 family)